MDQNYTNCQRELPHLKDRE